jgi:septal ring factor EnvC (AmiA/AmiB activator)
MFASRNKLFASIAICFCTVTGCSDSGLVSTVAEKAARVATLEVELATAKETAKSAQRELQQVSADLADTEAKLATAEAAATEAQKLNQELSNQNGELAKKHESMSAQLALAKSQLSAIAAERRQQERRLAVVGYWQWTANKQTTTRYPEFLNYFEFRQDGTGVYRQGLTLKNVKQIDYQISWNETGVPGVYDLRGVTGNKVREAITGTFRVSPDGQTAVMEGWDTTEQPRDYKREPGDSGSDKPVKAVEASSEPARQPHLPPADSRPAARDKFSPEQIAEFERLRKIRADQLETEISIRLENAARQAARDPDGALNDLKHMNRLIAESDDLKPEARDRLNKQIDHQVGQLVGDREVTQQRYSDIEDAEFDLLRRRRPERIDPPEPVTEK